MTQRAMATRQTYSIVPKHNNMLNEQAVNLTAILERPVACRDVLHAILELAPQIDTQRLAQCVLDKVKQPRRGRRPQPVNKRGSDS